ncbi:FCD domain-containing protein [Nitratireductor sp. CAU 1489]|uniref:FCD domain-containing protein n=1 Tax=Nitratireductor arenosus TaxID=2682096 RepID=A0A844QKP1_9HYPH|nr:GntR family transcriptional regulator [Nitratireductor arenosus]MVA98520.1 FCD domain-containing protein [Nitratireductor arenosus]
MTINASSTVEQIAAHVTAAVRAGQLAPGQRLTEAEFSARLGVSRSSVREAFSRLTADGLLALAPHRGVTVRRLTRGEVDNLFAVRGALEALAVRLATPALSAAPARLAALRRDMDAAAEANDMNGFSDLNARFHALFTETAGNDLLGDTLARLSNSIYWLQFRVMVDRSAVFRTNREHVRIADAVLAGDAAGAQAAMLAHVETARRLIQSLDDDHFAP